MNIARAFKVTDCQRCEKKPKKPSRYVVADLRARRPFWELVCYRCLTGIPPEQRVIAFSDEREDQDRILDGLAWTLCRRDIGPGDLPTLFVRAARLDRHPLTRSTP